MTYRIRFETRDGNIQEVEISARSMGEAITIFQESYEFAEIDRVEVAD